METPINIQTMTQNTIINLPGYHISENFYQGVRTLVYRGTRISDRQAVIIKILRNRHPNFQELVQFRNQYFITSYLEHPNIVQPLGLQRHGNGYALVMPDEGAIALPDYWQQSPQNLKEFLSIAMQLAAALEYLTQQRIIHKDIKSANILIHPQTKQVKLIDFSISSLLPKEQQQLLNPNVLEGTLTYISPEQTGRMNRGIDYRTDFYSLGVTFFELLTGKLPFESNDPMELVHCHIAQKVKFPENSEQRLVPPALQAIVLKLMAKNAENRYQSAFGLKHDLERCWQQLNTQGQIEIFKLGERDVCDRFLIPEKLYGRETEVQTLLDAFERVADGSSEMMLVAGFSGIGKTAVVNEVHKPIVRQRGYFIKGKFDQFNRNIPLFAFVQALRDLMEQLLSESDKQLAQWRTKILKAVGTNGQVLIEVIPELERILEKQPPAPELSGTAAQNRFNLLFKKFIQVLTTPEHPLVIFLDDLQWADSASLGLLKLLLNQQQGGYLLIVGAYRDNEVWPTHPLMLTIDEITQTVAAVNTITLTPLNQESLNVLVAETLQCSESLALPLTKLVYQKTKGNPFFSTQFLKALHAEGHIIFQRECSYWQCDLSQINVLSLTDDVVELMVQQLQKLPNDTQTVLKLAACIGNQFDLETLAIVSEKSVVDTALVLWRALQAGLILPTNQTYKFFQAEGGEQVDAENVVNPTYCFLHDRVQQAAYTLIPETHKQVTHLQIGRMLWQNTPDALLGERIFEIVSQLNVGLELITEPAERQQLAALNLTAGRKAKASTAYSAALEYLNLSIQLLPEESWQSLPELTRSIYDEAAEAAFSAGNFEQLEALSEIILYHTNTLLEQVRLYELKIQSLQVQGQGLSAITLGREILGQLGVNLPETVSQGEIYHTVENTLAAIGDREIAELADLPMMNNPQILIALRIMASLVPSIFIFAPYLFPIVASDTVKLFLKYGNSPFSAPGYADFGIIVSSVLSKFKESYQFGQLALKMLDIFPIKTIECMTEFKVAAFTLFNQQHIRDSIALLQKSCTLGLETGDFLHFSASAQYGILYLHISSIQTLENIPTIIASYQSTLGSSQIFARTGEIINQTIENLTQSVPQPAQLVGDFFNETKLLPMMIAQGEVTLLHILFLNKVMLAYLFGDVLAAMDYSAQAENHLQGGTGMATIPLFHYYYGLAQLASYPTATPSQQEELLSQVVVHQAQIKQRSASAPMNFQHLYDLLEAEKQRVLGNILEAIEHYEQAIVGAKDNNYIQNEALANELAAKFYLDWEKQKIAQTYMIEAYYCYAQWGAKAKIEHLEQQYPQLLAPILQQPESPLNLNATVTPSHHTMRSSSTTSVLDFTTVIKASQTLSGEIELQALVSKLLQIVLENAGADGGALILHQAGSWEIIAHCQKQSCQLASIPLNSAENIPISIIRAVQRTQKMVLLNQVEKDTKFAGDSYLIKQQPQSLFCTPILNQGQLIAILYLENNLSIGAFTPQRVEILNLLCSQAAISIENARLYQQAQNYAQKLERSLAELQQAQLQLVQSEKMSALGNLVAGVAHEVNNPMGFLQGNIQPAQEYIQDLLGLIDLYQQKMPDPDDEIEAEIEEIDLEFIRTDLPQLLKSMKICVDRIRNICNSLRTFSRKDQEHKVSFNIHAGIDSTLLILKHRTKANQQRPQIQIIKDYQNIPEVHCFPGQLNQVFMNILANAIDAFEEANQGKTYAEIEADPNCITIETAMTNNQIQIQIQDNGSGMKPETKDRIFEQGFTTKAVGKGTGLGMAIAYQIITEKHNGKIICDSTVGKGTTFSLYLPIYG